MVAKCGEIKVWHWAHKGARYCDAWWENETEWHRAWKECFPVHWQEIVHHAPNGERHIADVKTDFGWVVEFQHSFLKPDERRSRDGFYPKLIWVVDARRRKRDLEQLNTVWIKGVSVGRNPDFRKVSAVGCRLLEEWNDCSGQVFFDIGNVETVVWRIRGSRAGAPHLVLFPRSQFVHVLQGTTPEVTGLFDAFLKEIPGLLGS